MRYYYKIKNFIQSLWFHVGAGLPRSSQQVIEYRYNICKSCELFDSINKECTVCGCMINKKRQFFNKLAWADQSCPEGKWQPTNE